MAPSMVLVPQSRLEGLGDAVELADLLVETAQTMKQSLRDVRLGGPAGVAAASEACIAANALAKLSKTANEVMRAHRQRWHTTGKGPAVGAGTLEASKGTARRPNSARAAPTSRSSRPRSAASAAPARPKTPTTSRAAPAPASPMTVRGESAAMGGPLGSLASPMAPAMVAKVAETLVVGSPSPGRGIAAKAAKSPTRPSTAGTLRSPGQSPAKTVAPPRAASARRATGDPKPPATKGSKTVSRVLSRDNTPRTETLMVRREGGSVANVKPVPVTHRRVVGAPATKAAEEVSELLGAVGRKLGVGVPIVALVDVETETELSFERYMNPIDGRVFPYGKVFVALTQEEVAARRKGVPKASSPSASPLKAKPKPKKKPKGQKTDSVEPLVERLSKPNKAAVSFQVTRAGARDASSSVPVTVPVSVETIGEVLRVVSTALEVRAVAFTPCLSLYHQPDPVTLKAAEVATPSELVNGGVYLFRCAGDLAPGMVNNTAALRQKELLRQIAAPKAEKVDSFIVGVAHLADPYGAAVAMRLPGAKALQHLTFDDLCRRVRIAVGLSAETPVRGLFRADGTRLGSPADLERGMRLLFTVEPAAEAGDALAAAAVYLPAAATALAERREFEIDPEEEEAEYYAYAGGEGMEHEEEEDTDDEDFPVPSPTKLSPVKSPKPASPSKLASPSKRGSPKNAGNEIKTIPGFELSPSKGGSPLKPPPSHLKSPPRPGTSRGSPGRKLSSPVESPIASPGVFSPGKLASNSVLSASSPKIRPASPKAGDNPSPKAFASPLQPVVDDDSSSDDEPPIPMMVSPGRLRPLPKDHPARGPYRTTG